MTLYNIPASISIFDSAVQSVAAGTWIPQLLGSPAIGTSGGNGGLGQRFFLTF